MMTRKSGIIYAPRYAASYPYNAQQSGKEQDEIKQWCRDNFGEPNLIHGKWYPLVFTIQFAIEADRNWFLLRWS